MAVVAGTMLFVVGVASLGDLIALRKPDINVTPRESSIPHLVDEARERSYFPLAGQIYAGETKWLFDGQFVLHGTVVSWWRADTVRNRHSCKEEWHKLATYKKLCMAIADQKILAVKLGGINHEMLAFLPVSRIAHIDVGDTVSIRSGVITENNRLEKFAELLNFQHHFSP